MVMKTKTKITCLFLDIGGVLLTNGWDHHARKRAAAFFKLDRAEMEERHRLNFATLEEDRLTLADYLNRVVFFERRDFTRAEFRRFMFAQSKPVEGMIGLIRQLKARYGLKLVVVSNEARELNAHRISEFKLAGFVDAFVSSCFVGVRKPDAEIFRLALEVAQTPLAQIVYVEDTLMFLQVAAELGIHGIQHVDFAGTRSALAALGLQAEEGGDDESQ